MTKIEAYEFFTNEYIEEYGLSIVVPEIESEEFNTWFNSNYPEEDNKMNLFEQAKEAYYNGNPIMSDQEFDELEASLGLKNKSFIGTRHNPSYTVKHPVIMGSLSKVQVKEDKNGEVDWEAILEATKKYVKGCKNLIITPKYDGCSFEVVIDNTKGNNEIISISSRGDGKYGKDLGPQLVEKVRANINKIEKYVIGNYAFCENDFESILGKKYILRGEVLISKDKYEKYKDKYVNTRSFVAGVLGADYNATNIEYLAMLNDLDIVIYDFKIINNNIITDYDWNRIKNLQDKPEFCITTIQELDVKSFEDLYYQFEDFRKQCKYSLDGFVIKPQDNYRKLTPDIRPKDCVAIKFIPQLQETEVTSITWNLGKTGELIPIINVNPVEMDGKMVSKCSGHNYGYLVDNKIGEGTKVILSLAGDIIPFLYKVTNTSNFINVEIPEEYETEVDGCHLMAILDEKSKARRKFINSVCSLNIPTLGPANAKDIFEYITKDNGETDDFFGEETSNKELIDNILLLTPEEVYFGVGGGKSGSNAQKAYKKVLDQLTLVDVLKTCNFKLCGGKAAEQIEKKLTDQEYDFNHLPSVSYEWTNDKNSEQYKYLVYILERLGRTFDDFRKVINESSENNEEKIPVILTGEPNNYETKAEFLRYNPQYRMTGSWKEVKIVFTNSFDSNTGKMKKAREKGIEIRLY